MRLDLWFAVALLIYTLGSSHWLVGLALGLLVVLHRNFGIIYVAAYIQLLLVLFTMDLTVAMASKKGDRISFLEMVRRHLSANRNNILLVGGFFILGFLARGGIGKENPALLYQKIGIGFLRIGENSFYWYVPIVISTLFVALIARKDIFPRVYFTTGIFLVFAGIGNSLYFFGRSHENNIINISAILVLCFFFLLDCMERCINADEAAGGAWQRWAKIALRVSPYVFIAFLLHAYQDQITHKASEQYRVATKAQAIKYPLIKPDLREIKRITHNSPSVYFMTLDEDFFNCYYGGYAPVGYFSPYRSWLVKKDLVHFLQNLLDNSYYLVANHPCNINEILPQLTYRNHAQAGDQYLIVWK